MFGALLVPVTEAVRRLSRAVRGVKRRKRFEEKTNEKFSAQIARESENFSFLMYINKK